MFLRQAVGDGDLSGSAPLPVVAQELTAVQLRGLCSVMARVRQEQGPCQHPSQAIS